MEILIFLFFISNTILVRCDDNVAMESNVNYQVHPEPEENFIKDHQVKEVQGQNHFHINVQDYKYPDVKYSEIHHVLNGLRHNGNEIQAGQLYQNLQHPHLQERIQNSEASHLHRVNDQDEYQKTSGFSSYVEHVSHKETDEIQSALQEHDIKRLVPKSGISFKVYHNKNIQVASRKGQSEVSYPSQGNTEIPVTIQSILDSEVSQNQEIKNIHPGYVATEHTHGVGVQTINYAATDVSPSKSTASPLQEINDKSSSYVEPSYKFKVKHGEGKATSHIEFNQKSKKPGRKEVAQLQMRKPTYLGAQTAKPLEMGGKVVENTQQGLSSHLADSYLEIEGLKGDQNTASAPFVSIDSGKISQTQTVTHTTATPYVSINSGNIGQSHVLTHSTAAPYVGIDSVQISQSHFAHSTAAPYTTIDSGKAVIIPHTTPSSYLTIESPKPELSTVPTHATIVPFSTPKPELVSYVSHLAKTNQNEYIGHVSTQGTGGQTHYLDSGGSSYLDTEVKHNPNNFDHQKALEGSTSFDIKNAIGNTESTGHEVMKGFVKPAPVQIETEKQTLLYIVPKSPILGKPIAQYGEQVKNYGHVGHDFYPLSLGKYQSIPFWSGEHFKHVSLPPNDLHQTLVKLHLPKEELYHHKQPLGFHQEIPVIKFVSDSNFQIKKPVVYKPLPQTLKIVQSTVPEWTFYKTKTPNLNTVLVKPDLMSLMQEPGKKVIPILVKKRKARGSKDVGVVYGKTIGNWGPAKPRQEKSVFVNFLPETAIVDGKDRNNEFSVSASYKVDRRS